MSALLWLWMVALADARVALQPREAGVQTDDRRVRTLPLAVEGEIATPLRERLTKRLHEGLGRGTFEVVGADRQDARQVRTTVTARARDLDIVIELVDRRGVEVLARVEQECDTCGTTEAEETMSALAMTLSRQLDIGQRSVAQAEAPPPPMVTASPVMPLDRLRPQRRPVRWAVGWAALAGGAIGTAAGVALIAIDDQPIARKCNGSNVDRDGTCRWMHNTIVPGAVIGTIGVGLLSTGIAMLVIEGRRTPNPVLRAMIERTPAGARARALVRR